jgi:phosphoglycerol transferase MdoB-like AlkP superfamily enzyme
MAAWFHRLPARVRLALAFVAIAVAAFTMLRAVFWLAFRGTAPDYPGWHAMRAFWIGFRFDLRLAVVLAAPILLLSLVPRLAIARAPRVWTAYLASVAGLLMFVYGVDFGHYGWMHSRVRYDALEHLNSPGTTLAIAWESYPLVWAFLGIGAFAAAAAWGARRLVRAIAAREAPAMSRRARVALVAALVLGFAGAMNGTLAGYPLRWSHAYFSANPFASALGLNPVLYFFDTWEAPRSRYDVAAVRESYDLVAAYLGVEKPDRDALTFDRRNRPRDTGGRRPNVVIVFLESFGASKCGAFGRGGDATPRFTALAREGVLFRAFFVASLPTGRSIFSLVTGIPDIHPGDPASYNPACVRQRTLLTDFEGYDKLYLYTGNLTWANLRGLLAHNVPGIRLHEYGDYASPRNDGWGISDLALFEEACAVMRGCERPFVAILQTSGNHPPYTIPKEARGFEVVNRPADELSRHGLRSNEEYNALRFMDHAIGRFIDQARREPFFENTIFAFLGDHGARGTGSDPMEATGLNSHHVPFVLYAPSLLAPRVIDEVASSVDVLPTVASLAGVSYVNRTLGRDLFDMRAGAPRVAFVRMGAIDGEFYFAPELGRLHRWRSDSPGENARGTHSDDYARMERWFHALASTARYLLHHNKPE